MKRSIVFIFTSLVFVGGAAVFVMASAPGTQKEEPTVGVEIGTLVDKALATGRIVPKQEVEIKSKLPGTVVRVFAEEGQYVRAGEPLIEVKPTPTPLEYAQKKRILEMRKLVEEKEAENYRRARKLFERQLISEKEFKTMENAYEESVINRKMAEEEFAILNTGKTVIGGRTIENIITSPMAGHVLNRYVDVGNPVIPLNSYQPGTVLMIIADMNELQLEGVVDEIDVGRIREGMPAEIKIGTFPDQIIGGTLSRIALKSREKDNANVFDVVITHLVFPSGLRLRAGYSGNADIIVKRAMDVPILPERVLEFRENTTFVRLPTDLKGTPEMREVQIGMSDGISVEITAGLQAGDRVLDNPVQEIR